jgi:cobalt-zinc-cadmium efflux system protein
LLVSLVNFFVNIPILDPILAILFTVFILWNVIKNLQKIVKIFMQSVPSGIDLQKIEKHILSVNLVHGIHDTHIWTMNSEEHIMTCHIEVKDRVNEGYAKKQIRSILKEYNITHSTIEIDYLGEKCDYRKC